MSRRNKRDVPTGADSTAVVVLGSLNMDLSVTVNEIPRPGETVLGGPVHRQPGGKGANQAVAASRLGADVRLIGQLGRDEVAEQIRRVLADAGVDVTHVRSVDDFASGLAFVTVDSHGENAIVVASGANAEVSPAVVDAEAAALGSARIAVTQLETPLHAVARFAELCEAHGVDLVLNAAPYHEVPPRVLRRCRYLVLNRDEATSLTGVVVHDRSDAVEALLKAARLGARTVVVTLGAEGCVALVDGHVAELDAYQVSVKDTTGAGDAFVGAFAVALARAWSFDDSMRFAAAAGAIACGRTGAQTLTSSSEIEQLVAEQPRAVRRRPASDLSRTPVSSDR